MKKHCFIFNTGLIKIRPNQVTYIFISFVRADFPNSIFNKKRKKEEYDYLVSLDELFHKVLKAISPIHNPMYLSVCLTFP